MARATSPNVIKPVKIELKGIEELRRDLLRYANLQRNAQPELQRIFLDAVGPIHSAVAQRVPVRTGRLRAAVKKGPVPGEGAAFATVDRNDAWYARLVEFGHKPNSQPHPFWRPGVRAGKKQALPIIVTGLRKLIDDMARR